MILFIVLFIFGLAFLLIYVSKLGFFRSITVDGIILSIEEVKEENPDWIADIVYFYPKISYSYNVDGNEYLGEIGAAHASKYKCQKSEKTTKIIDFFWKKLEPGSPIKVTVNSSNFKQSMLDHYQTRRYKSEILVFLVLSIIFFVLALGAFLFLR